MKYKNISIRPDRPLNWFILSAINVAGFLCRPIEFHLFYRASKFLGKFVLDKCKCSLNLGDDSYFTFFLEDPYWNRLIFGGFVYEAEIDQVLQIISDTEYTFLDLGANYGYWSVKVSSLEYGAHECIAVEPVAPNHEILSDNCLANQSRFCIYRNAVSQISGQAVTMELDPSSISSVGASIAPRQSLSEEPTVNVVSTISIDDLCKREGVVKDRVVVKLDVEGAEIDALLGGKRLLESDLLLIYEDHGIDPKCEVSEYVLSLGLTVCHFEAGVYCSVESIEDVQAIKSSSSKGYNLFAFHEGGHFSDLLVPSTIL